jgi:phytoene dehydrogenase-like protein
MDQQIDMLVIGSGFGGLTAAALAAHDGLSVQLIERHTRPGGCAGDFGLGGFWFPAGATVVTGLEPGGILRQVFDTLTVATTETGLDPSIVFHAGGVAVPYVSDLEEWKRSLRERFPETAPAYERFWDWTHHAGGAVYRIGATLPSLPPQRLADVRRTLPAASPAVVPLLPLVFRTLEHEKRRLGARGEPVIDGMIDALLMDATGAPAAECSAIQGAIALDLYRRGCQQVAGGTAKLAMQLVRSIRQDGGGVRFGVGVDGLREERNGWVARLSDGSTIRSRTVIANVPPAALERLLGRPPALPKAGTSWSAFVLHLGIDAEGLAPLHPYHQVVHPGSPHGNSFISIFPSAKVGRSRWSVSVSRHVDPRAWQTFDSETACLRLRMEQRLLSDVETVIPDVRNRVLLLQSATPRTYERYTGRPGGFVGGLVQRPNVVALRAPGHRPGRGLFLAGDHVFPGQGTVGTALSGINAYRDAVERLGRKPSL